MRSQEGVGGPGTAVAARGPSGREKLSALGGQFRHESPRQEPETPSLRKWGCDGGRLLYPEKKKQAKLKACLLLTTTVLSYFSLHPHLYSRAYINFRNPDDILLFRDRFDGYVFIDSKGLEYPAVVEFAPFQKIARKKLKRRDAKTGSIEDDPEYKKFLETYCVEEEKAAANPETLLGEIEAKTRELVARRTTPLLEYIKNRKLEKQRIREEKREERRRRELEKKRLREEEKRKRREEERCKRKEADKQRKTTEKEIRIKLLKKPEKGEEPTTEKPKERGEEVDFGEGRWETCVVVRARPLESRLEKLRAKSQNDSDREHRDMERRSREKEPEAQRCHADDRKHRAHCEPGGLPRRTDAEPRWGRGSAPDGGKKGGQDSGAPGEATARTGRGQRCEDSLAPRKEHPGNKDGPALGPRPPEEGRGGKTEVEDTTGAGPARGEEAE
uniref:UPF3 domain-containing protein n=1 Tax=Propithecus coquereli TaxID=379532 RepID=A0A2K6EF59_PROCO